MTTRMLAGLFSVVFAAGCATGKGAGGERTAGASTGNLQLVTVSHGAHEPKARQTVRLRPKEDLWVVIKDANPLIYSYSLTREDNPENAAVRQALGVLLTGGNVSAGSIADFVEEDLDRKGVAAAPHVCPSSVAARAPGAGAPRDSLTHFATNLLSFGRVLVDLVELSDLADKNYEIVEKNVRTCMRDAATKLGLAPFVGAEAQLRSALEAYHSGATKAQSLTPEEEALYRSALTAIPGVAFLSRELRSLALGERRLHHDGAATGEELIELTITNRLGDAYQPRRWTGTGLDISETKPTYREIELSLGFAGHRGDRTQYTLEPISGSEGSYVVRSTTDDRFSLAPSLFVSWLPFRGNYVFGLSGGIGVGGGNLASLTDESDLMLALTAGRDWLRVSAGVASTSEITSFGGLAAGDTTTNPNLLNNAVRERKARFVVGVHVTP